MLANANGVRCRTLAEPVYVVHYGRSAYLRDATGYLVTLGVPVECGTHLPTVSVEATVS